MKRILTLLFLVAVVSSCTKPSPAEVQEKIVEFEQNQISSVVTKHRKIQDIEIEGVVFENKREPYYGYLVTTWYLKGHYGEVYPLPVQVPLYGVDTKWFSRKIRYYVDWDYAYSPYFD